MMMMMSPAGTPRRRTMDRAIVRLGALAAAILAIVGLTTAVLSWSGWSRFDAQKALTSHEMSMSIRYGQIDSSLYSVNKRVDSVEDMQAKLNRRQLLMNYLQCTREIPRDSSVRSLCTEVIRDWLNQ